jgi:hypothetical protein
MEEELFVLGIKPAILEDSKTVTDLWYKADKTNCSYRIYDLRTKKNPDKGCLIIRIYNGQPHPRGDFGKLLGYYPKSVELFEDAVKNNIRAFFHKEIINFHGIQFNTMGLFNEAFAWCMQEYGQKILEHYGEIRVKKTVSEHGSGKEEIIEKIFYEVIEDFNKEIGLR